MIKKSTINVKEVERTELLETYIESTSLLLGNND